MAAPERSFCPNGKGLIEIVATWCFRHSGVMDPTLTVAIVVGWLLIGMLSGVWMARRGHDPLWVLLATPLGPLFLPIALERVRRRPALADAGDAGPLPDRVSGVPGPRVLVGMDGSEDAERTLQTVVRLLGPQCGLLVLAEVVHFEAADRPSRADLDAAAGRLSERAATIDTPAAVHTEVLAGPPGPALRQFARDQDMDLLAVGRRGCGRARRLLGSVSSDLVENSPVPVLVIEPAPTDGR